MKTLLTFALCFTYCIALSCSDSSGLDKTTLSRYICPTCTVKDFSSLHQSKVFYLKCKVTSHSVYREYKDDSERCEVNKFEVVCEPKRS